MPKLYIDEFVGISYRLEAPPESFFKTLFVKRYYKKIRSSHERVEGTKRL